MEEEVWKSLDFMGYPDYEVSNYGQVKSLERVIVCKNGMKRLVSEKVLKSSKTKKNYLQVNLNRNGISKMYLVHRLVALAHISNPNGYPIINHIDENRQNNHVSNLEWCTILHNNTWNDTHIKRGEKISQALKG